jgi:hypothetical protein
VYRAPTLGPSVALIKRVPSLWIAPKEETAYLLALALVGRKLFTWASYGPQNSQGCLEGHLQPQSNDCILIQDVRGAFEITTAS